MVEDLTSDEQEEDATEGATVSKNGRFANVPSWVAAIAVAALIAWGSWLTRSLFELTSKMSSSTAIRLETIDTVSTQITGISTRLDWLTDTAVEQRQMGGAVEDVRRRIEEISTRLPASFPPPQTEVRIGMLETRVGRLEREGERSGAER